jgi:hypothetical protein
MEKVDATMALDSTVSSGELSSLSLGTVDSDWGGTSLVGPQTFDKQHKDPGESNLHVFSHRGTYL